MALGAPAPSATPETETAARSTGPDYRGGGAENARLEAPALARHCPRRPAPPPALRRQQLPARSFIPPCPGLVAGPAHLHPTASASRAVLDPCPTAGAATLRGRQGPPVRGVETEPSGAAWLHCCRGAGLFTLPGHSFTAQPPCSLMPSLRIHKGRRIAQADRAGQAAGAPQWQRVAGARPQATVLGRLARCR